MLSGNLLFAHYCDRCWNKGELEEVTFTSAAAWNSGSEFILGVWDVWLSFRVVLVTGGQCEVVGIPLFLSLSWHPWGVCGWESTVCTLSAGSETSVVWEQQTQKAFHEAGGWFGGECKGGCGEKKQFMEPFFLREANLPAPLFTQQYVYDYIPHYSENKLQLFLIMCDSCYTKLFLASRNCTNYRDNLLLFICNLVTSFNKIPERSSHME